MVQAADVYAFDDGHLALCSSSKTKLHLWTIAGPFLRARQDDLPEQIGRAILEALSGSTSGLEVPNVDLPGHPFLNFCGMSDWNELSRKSRWCTIELEADVVEISPSRRSQKRGEWGHVVTSPKAVAPADDPEAIGRALLECLAHCR